MCDTHSGFSEMNGTSRNPQELQAILDAIDNVQAIIWFEPDGSIIEANQNFCTALGYRREEVIGRHHRIFVDPEFAKGGEYRQFWEKLRRGGFVRGEFTRRAKDGSEVFFDAVYQSILNEEGEVTKVFELARNITERVNMRTELQSQVDAISRSQAMIEFDLDGTILSANENFLKVAGYGLNEIQGRNHRIFVDPEYAASSEYREFWSKLARGEFVTSEFARVGKGGRQFWIQATYNPILDRHGKPTKVIKFATDITEQKTKTTTLIDGITEVSASIAEEAEKITSTSGELAKRSENQAATVEETSAAMEQISSTVNSNAANAEQATEQARNARSQAEKGGEVVDKAITAMNRIQDGSKQIRKFIEVIDSIAFQTNLLALNAGVEAARAGDAGRGFAVVASEVRALAQRASQSAKDINALIDSNAREVSEGATLVDETGSVLKDIMEGVAKVSDGIENIYVASREQASGLSEINTAISEIDKTTQQNATMAQESSATAATLVRNAEELQVLLGQDVKRPSAERPAAPRQNPNAPAFARTAPMPPRKVAVNETSVHTQDGEDWTEF